MDYILEPDKISRKVPVPARRYRLRTVILALLLGAVLGGGGAWYALDVRREAEENPDPSHVLELPPPDLRAIFALDAKHPETDLFYSERLGVGFTYLPHTLSTTPAELRASLREEDDLIRFSFHSIEVFQKDPDASLSEAITQRFLRWHDPADCFAEPLSRDVNVPEGYVTAQINYPDRSVDGSPFWESHSCPLYYSKTNGVQYFLMNEAVPGTFLFVRLGQASAAGDGTQTTATWADSIRIVR